MTPTRARRARAPLACLVAAALAVGAVGATAAAAERDPGAGAVATRATRGAGPVEKGARRDKLGRHDRSLLAAARATGEERVTLILATARGQTASVAASVRANGGHPATTDDRIGYVRADLPTSAVEKVAALRRVVAVDLDEAIPLPDPSADLSTAAAAGPASVTAPAPGPATPDANPYLPTHETGSVAFRAAHPTWDGRGVTIGILDSGVDLDHPALQTTTTGARKVVDWVTATDPVLDDDGTWLPMDPAVTASPTFVLGTGAGGASETWTAPAPGTFRFNRFSESVTAGSEPAGDVNRDGDTTDRFGVLYNPVNHDVWVDVDQDRTFTAGEKRRPYREAGSVGHFGTDDPATSVVERMPFVVEFRLGVDTSPWGGWWTGRSVDFVNIGLVENAHGTHVAGVVAGRGLFGGAMNGQAPGAKVVSSRACTWGGGCTAAALTDGMVDLVATRGVDVVTLSIGGLPALNDGSSARARLYDQLIAVYGVQLVVAAGSSGPGTNTIGDPAVASTVISVASSVSKDTWLADYGSVVSTPLALHPFSARGPREDGGLAPTVMAPGSAVSSVPRWLRQPDVAETGYALPVGYAMFDGSSVASPQVAGATALLLSAARASSLDPSPAQLRASVHSSARFVAGIDATSQGNGLVDVPRAWDLLRVRPTTRTYSTDAPVCTALSGLLATPHHGAGVHNRCAAASGGQVVGQAKAYAVRLTRTTGALSAALHRVRIVGNDGTFSAPTAVNLRRNRTATVTVTATPRTPGLHAAILQVDDLGTNVVDHVVLLSVVASDTLAAPSFTKEVTGSVERNLVQRHFVTVPEGAEALRVTLSDTAAGSQTRWIAYDPYGMPVDDTSASRCYTSLSDVAACDPTSRAYEDPRPGVWELVVDSRRTSPVLVNPYTLSATAEGAAVSAGGRAGP